MGRPKGKKDSKPRKKRYGTRETIQSTKPKQSEKPKIETETHSETEEFIAEAEPELNPAPEVDLTSEVELLLKGIFEALALLFNDSRIGLSQEEVSGSAPSCVAYYTRVIKPKIENTDALAAAVVVGALLMSRAPYIKESVKKWQRPKTPQMVYPSPEPIKSSEVTQ